MSVAAIDDADLPSDPDLRASLVAYFGWVTGLVGTHPHSVDDVPADLPLPRWNREGPVIGGPPR